MRKLKLKSSASATAVNTTSKPTAKRAAKAAVKAAKPAAGKRGKSTGKPSKPATTAAEKPKREKRPVHGETVKLTYSGPSAVLNRASTDAHTPVRFRPSRGLSERVASLVADMHRAYGSKPFPRYNAGAGALGRALFLGHIEYVSGADNVTSDENGPVYHGRNSTFRVIKPVKSA